jgi:hypothetical protein
VCEGLVENWKDYIQVREVFVFVVYERSLKININQKLYLNTLY